VGAIGDDGYVDGEEKTLFKEARESTAVRRAWRDEAVSDIACLHLEFL
jgi:hypothetical protein